MSDWIRVTPANPCPICGKKSWCEVSRDGEVALCMKQASDRPKTFKNGEVGYIHRLIDGPKLIKKWNPKPEPPAPTINAEATMKWWSEQTSGKQIARLADELGVRASSLMELRVAWAAEHRAFAFPMRNGYGAVVGIRLRNREGKKWAVRGSRSGIFLPYCVPQDAAFICEGPTDTAAALSIGLYAIGRPSCSGGMPDIIIALRRLGIRRVIIIADNDDPGLTGADMLSRHLEIPCCLFTLPCKDVREAVARGMDAETLLCMVNQHRWHNAKENKV
jgi:5S rRNA maturation endonuclease (ribonuclease M5)